MYKDVLWCALARVPCTCRLGFMSVIWYMGMILHMDIDLGMGYVVCIDLSFAHLYALVHVHLFVYCGLFVWDAFFVSGR